MSCEKCKNKEKCAGCSGACPGIPDHLLALWRACEPWCMDGGCRPGPHPYPHPAPCAGGLCPVPQATASVYNAPGAGVGPNIIGLLNYAVSVGALAQCVDANGLPGYAIPGGPCIISKADCDCFKRFGTHFNEETRLSFITPTMGEAIALTFSAETVTLINPVEIQDDWWMVDLGALGLSHKFCLKEASAVDVNGAPVLVDNVAIAGSRMACDEDEPGFGIHVINTPTPADPEDIDVTPERCACEELCATTPAGGGEFFFIHVPPGATPTEIKVKVRRCDWLKPADHCIVPKGNKRPTNSFTYAWPPLRINTTLTVPFLPAG